MRVMRSRASFIGAAMPKRIECIDDRFLLIADDPHFTAQGAILSGRTKDQNIGYCRGISDGGRHRLAGQLRLQLEAALEAARATRPSAKRKSPVVLPTGNPTNPKPNQAPQLSRGSADRATGSGGFPNVVLGGRTPGAAAARAARAPLSRSSGVRDLFSAAARAS